MAALPYMQLFIADYLADTMHLSTEEHGAYLLLMFNYWQTGKPIPKSRLAKIARVSKEKWSEIEEVLSEFFECADESWAHLRIERDLENVAASPGGRKLPGSNGNSDYKGRIYFITGPDLDGVKIGYSKNPWARLSELRSSYDSSLSVVAMIKTVDKPETTIHSILSEYHVGNGWYQKDECINSLILAISTSKVTTVDGICNYVANYGSDSSPDTVVATTATNKDPDKDPDKDIKHMSDSEKPPNQISPPSDKKYPDEFEILWREYPRREGSNSKSGALRSWKARRREGIPDEIMLAAVKRYHAYCQFEGMVGTKFVKLAQTFLGPDHEFDNPWKINPEGKNHGKNTQGTIASTAVDAVRFEQKRWECEQAESGGTEHMEAMGNLGGNLWQPLGDEEWIETISTMDSSNFSDDG